MSSTLPLFFYTSVSQSGKKKEGNKEASSVSELARLLKEEGFILTSAKPQQQIDPAVSFLKKASNAAMIFFRISLVDKMLFTRHLAVMVKAGFSINKALQVLVSQTENKRFAKIIAKVEEDLRGGIAFGDAVSKYPDVFSDLYINMVRAGEAGGNLEENLKLMAVQMKKDHDLSSKIKSAMMYPLVILSLMILIGAAMMIFVMPKLISVFEELNAELPLTTKIIVAISQFLVDHWLIAILAVLLLIIFLRFILATKQAKTFFDKLVLKMPIFGEISKKINSARMARSLSSLIQSGVSIIKALEITSGTVGNTLFKKSLIESAKEVQKGNALSQILSNYPNLYPPIVTNMIQVGEETGTLGEITKKLAAFYEEEVANITKGLSTIIEPILMIIIGAAVGFFAISMIQPMYSVMDTI